MTRVIASVVNGADFGVLGSLPYPGPSWLHLGRYGPSRVLWGAIAPPPSRYVARVIPLGAKPHQNSRLENGFGHLGGTSETNAGGSPQWPVARMATRQNARIPTPSAKPSQISRCREPTPRSSEPKTL